MWFFETVNKLIIFNSFNRFNRDMETYKASLPTAAEDAPANLKQVIFLFKSFCIWGTLIGVRAECWILNMLFLLWGEIWN